MRRLELASGVGLIVLLTIEPVSGEPAADSVVIDEPGGVSFAGSRTVNGRRFVLLGAGMRTLEARRLYAIGLYIEEAGGRAAFPALVSRASGRDHARLTARDHAQSFVAELRRDIEQALEGDRSLSASERAPAPARALLDLFASASAPGEEVAILAANGALDVSVGAPGAASWKSGPRSPKLARALLAVWLGPHAVQADLRRALVNLIDRLGQ